MATRGRLSIGRTESVVVKQVTSHRNGITGRPFDTVSFTYEDGSRQWELVGVLPRNGQPDECFVIEPSNPDSSWRGDNFYAPLLRAIKGE